MAFKLPPITVLPGGRKVRDYDHLTVEAKAEQRAAEEKAAKKLELPKQTSKSKPEKAEDESLG
jgi:hypothetical protein